MVTRHDKEIIQGLARRMAEIAALPAQEEKRRLWRRLNAKRPERPMVMIDQVCWNEMDPGDELTLRCSDPECREYEQTMRRTLFQWDHFRVDMVVEPYVRVNKAVVSTGFGIVTREDTVATDRDNDVVAHRYHNQFQADDDLERLKDPCVSHDTGETARRLGVAHELFDGILPVRAWGADPYLGLWDPISSWMGVQDALYALMDRPEFMHRLVERLTRAYLAMLDQLEAQGLLCGPQSLIHCTGAWTDDLPAPGYDSEHPRARDMWMFGLAQMFSTVSPAMFDEYEVPYASRICGRFGIVYYGCCDPLDRKMAQVRRIPGVRKVSMSPWVDQERGAQEIGKDYVFSRKPSPAFLAPERFDPDGVREDLAATRRICDRYGCPLEYILKDISTVAHQPQRLFDWARIAMEVATA